MKVLCILRYMCKKFWSEHSFDVELVIFGVVCAAVLTGVWIFSEAYPPLVAYAELVFLIVFSALLIVLCCTAFVRASVYLVRLVIEAVENCRG